MGRELRRVPLDFDWPMDEVWIGYLQENEYDDDGNLVGQDKSYDPPAGDGYQMWENVSEGSPISPVFTQKEELAHWLAAMHSDTGNYEQWLATIEIGYVPSLFITDSKVYTGVQAAPIFLKEKDNG